MKFWRKSALVSQAAKTKYYRVGDLNNRQLIFVVLEAGKSKMMVPAKLVLGEGLLPGL